MTGVTPAPPLLLLSDPGDRPTCRLQSLPVPTLILCHADAVFRWDVGRSRSSQSRSRLALASSSSLSSPPSPLFPGRPLLPLALPVHSTQSALPTTTTKLTILALGWCFPNSPSTSLASVGSLTLSRIQNAASVEARWSARRRTRSGRRRGVHRRRNARRARPIPGGMSRVGVNSNSSSSR